MKLQVDRAVAWLRRGRARVVTLGLALAALGIAGCVGPSCPPDVCPQTTVFPRSDIADKIQDLYILLWWLSVFVTVLVEGALIYAMIRFRSRPTDSTRPPQLHGNSALEIGWTIAPAVILVIIAIPTLQLLFEMRGAPPRDALEIEVVGHQWWWEIRYPDSNVVTANEIHVPLGRPVNFVLRSADVLHAFWVPQMGGKMDIIPGHRNHMFFTPQALGEYYGQCTEFCGLQHANMRMRLIVDSPSDFQAWVQRQQQPAPAQPPTDELLAGQQAFTRSGCIACHRIAGTSAQGVIGPDLTHVGSRTTIGAGILDNTPEHLYEWIEDPQALKPGNLMPNLHVRPDDIRSIVTYLQSLK